MCSRSRAQFRFFERQREVLEATTLDDATFERSLELSARTLTEYVLYREAIIDRLRKTTGQDAESEVHNLIVPRYRRFEEGSIADSIYQNNAWLLDDRFMSYRTILSEKKMSELIAAVTLDQERIEDDRRPDIGAIFSADPDEEAAVDVVVIELKRRADDQKENSYAPTQLAQRATKLVEHCPNIQRMWYFAVLEISDEFESILRTQRWVPLFSRGRLLYQEMLVSRRGSGSVPAPTFILSYDAVIKDAAARNHTFLEVLKSDIKRAVKAAEAREQYAGSLTTT